MDISRAAGTLTRMPIVSTGPECVRRGCWRPEWEDGLCHACLRLAKLFDKDPYLFAYKPLYGYSDQLDAVELPWELWEQEAQARGVAVADLLTRYRAP